MSFFSFMNAVADPGGSIIRGAQGKPVFSGRNSLKSNLDPGNFVFPAGAPGQMAGPGQTPYQPSYNAGAAGGQSREQLLAQALAAHSAQQLPTQAQGPGMPPPPAQTGAMAPVAPMAPPPMAPRPMMNMGQPTQGMQMPSPGMPPMMGAPQPAGAPRMQLPSNPAMMAQALRR